MIYPLRFLWKQLNGPQVTAFVTGIYNYIKDQFDKTLEYYHNISVTSATAEHLETMGALAGFARPLVTLIDEGEYVFTFGEEEDFEQGFGDVNNSSVGGHFTEVVSDKGQIDKVSLVYYQALMQAYFNSKAHIGSLELWDQLAHAIREVGVNKTNIGTFKYLFVTPDSATVGMINGDIRCQIVMNPNFSQRPEYVYAILESLANTAWAPQPRVFPEIIYPSVY